MKWNWQLPKWPHFTYDPTAIHPLEEEFLQGIGGAFALFKHLNKEDQKRLSVEILTLEGLKSSEIEGEVLERKSLQSSIKRHFGLKADNLRGLPKEQGMADLMCHVYDTFEQPLNHEMLFQWHSMVIPEERGLESRGSYRLHKEPMQIVSGRYSNSTVYFEAPPSEHVHKEMTAFIHRFNHPNQKKPMLGEAALLHVYFESIHPFEDGNGRIGRALIEKFLSQRLEHSLLMVISRVLQQKRKDYYAFLGECNRSLNISGWTLFFSKVIIQAQKEAFELVSFLMFKTRLMSQLTGKINIRQEKALLRIFSEGPKGFSGGLSAENYIAITKTSRATATRDLADLVEKGVLIRTGQLRHTRYWLKNSVIA